MKTLEDLLRMKVQINGSKASPDFRVAVQCESESGVQVIVHALGHNSDTLALLVHGDEITKLDFGRQVPPHRSGGGEWVGK